MMIDFNAFFSLVDFGVIIQSLGWIFLAIITFVEKVAPKGKKPWTMLFTFIGKLITKDFAETQKKLIDRMDSLSLEVKEVARSVDETRAIAARVRILRFGDELTAKIHSTKPYSTLTIMSVTAKNTQSLKTM